jgi:hypothetical protein
MTMKTRLAIALVLVGGLVAAPAAHAPAAHAAAIPPPVHHGTLRISGHPRDGATVTATGLRWHAPRLPRGMNLLSFAVAYSWQSCDAAGTHCRAGADRTAAPFAARRYAVGKADTGRRLRLTETAAEVVQTQRNPFTFQVIRRSVSVLTAAAVRAYLRYLHRTGMQCGTPAQSEHHATQRRSHCYGTPHRSSSVRLHNNESTRIRRSSGVESARPADCSGRRKTGSRALVAVQFPPSLQQIQQLFLVVHGSSPVGARSC